MTSHITLAIFAAATLIGAVVLGIFLDRTARRQAVEQSLLRAQGRVSPKW